MYKPRHSTVFRGGRISEVFQKSYDNIISAIDREAEDYILNVNETEYVAHVESKYKLIAPVINFDGVYADSFEEDIPAEYFPGSFDVYSGKTYKKEVIQFFIPVTGDISLLRYGPANTYYIGGGGNFEAQKDAIVTEFINFYNDADEIKRKYEAEVNGLRGNYGSLIVDIDSFNNSLASFILDCFTKRRALLLDKNSLLSSLGVPIRRKDNVAATFAVPKPVLRDKVMVKPVVTEAGFKAEPTLDQDNYFKILKIINDVGRNFERMPSVYKNKGEEDLRDHMLMTLDPNFEMGSAGGETFNKSGKTDILLRYDSSVVFVAECKFWSGEKNYLATIDQLLGYLTWRDTKAAVVIFVKQKDFSSILEKVESATSKHSNYLRFVDKSDQNWFNFHFHINGDSNREVKLAVQLYHLPGNE